MKKQPLLPASFKLIGWFLFTASLVFHILNLDPSNQWEHKLPVIISDEILGEKHFFTFTLVPVYNTLLGVCALTGLVFICFSKTTNEDEYIHALRLNSWLWSIWCNSLLLLLCFLFVYGPPFFYILLYGLYSLFLIFIIRFQYLLHKNSKLKENEE